MASSQDRDCSSTRNYQLSNLCGAALLLWFCYFKPRRQRNAALAAEAKGPPSAPVGVRTAEPFDAYAVKGPETGNQVSQRHFARLMNANVELLPHATGV